MVTADARDESSEDRYGRRLLTVESDMFNGLAYAENYADFLLTKYSEPTARVTLALRNDWPSVIGRELLDLVTVEESHTAVDSNFIVTSVEHDMEFDDQGARHTLDMALEVRNRKDYFILDLSELDGDDVLGF